MQPKEISDMLSSQITVIRRCIIAFTVLIMFCNIGFGQTTSDLTEDQMPNDPEAGFSSAINTIGKFRGDYLKSAQALEPSARTGDPLAQQALAETILLWNESSSRSIGSPYSIKDAVALYLSAASKSRPTMVFLQTLYYTGARGFPKDINTANCISRIYNQSPEKDNVYSCVLN